MVTNMIISYKSSNWLVVAYLIRQKQPYVFMVQGLLDGLVKQKGFNSLEELKTEVKRQELQSINNQTYKTLQIADVDRIWDAFDKEQTELCQEDGYLTDELLVQRIVGMKYSVANSDALKE